MTFPAISSDIPPLDSPEFTTNITTPAITLGATPITSTGTQVNYLNTTTGTTTLDDELHYNSATDSLSTKAHARVVSGIKPYKLQFIVDTTLYAPEAGDSLFQQDAFIEKHIEVYRNGLKQYRNATGSPQWRDGYRYQKSTGIIIFKPILSTNEEIVIEVTDSTKWTDLEIEDPLGFLSTDGHTVGWFISDSTATITKDGADSVSVWADYLDSGHDLLATDETKQCPVWSADGILFNGTTSRMLTGTFTWNQPAMYYIVIKQITWTSLDYIFDGYGDGTTRAYQYPSSPKLQASAGSASGDNSDLVINTWGILRVLFNGASSKIQVNAESAVTGDFGSEDPEGFALGFRPPENNDRFSNIQVQEIILRNVADSESTQTLIINYLNDKYSVY